MVEIVRSASYTTLQEKSWTQTASSLNRNRTEFLAILLKDFRGQGRGVSEKVTCLERGGNRILLLWWKTKSSRSTMHDFWNFWGFHWTVGYRSQGTQSQTDQKTSLLGSFQSIRRCYVPAGEKTSVVFPSTGPCILQYRPTRQVHQPVL